MSNNSSTIRFAIDNLFNLDVYNVYIKLPSQNLVATDQFIFSYTTFKLIFTHNFGNSRVKEIRNRSKFSEEEKGRVQP